MRRNKIKTDGKVILRSVPSPEVGRRVVGLLSQLMPTTPPEKIAAGIAKPPVVLAKRIRPEKGEKLVMALTKMGANAAFVPLRPGEEEKLAIGNLQPRVVEIPVEITPPPGRILRKWLRRTTLALLLSLTLVYAVVETIPRFYPKGIAPIQQPGRLELGGFRPVGEPLPSLQSIHPLDMMAVMKLQFRLAPDRRLSMVLASITNLFEGMILNGEANGRFRPGPLRSDGNTLVIPLIMDNRVAAEVEVAQPLTFSGMMEAGATWISMLATAVNVAPPPQIEENAIPGLEAALMEVHGLDPRLILNGLGTLDTISRTQGPRWSILKAAARGYANLHMTLFPDRTGGLDRLAAHGLALLALARWIDPEADLLMEESLLAYQMGYTAHALTLLRGKAFYSASPLDRMMVAFIARDTRQFAAFQTGDGDMIHRYLSARLYRELDETRSAEISSDALLATYPDLFPAMVEAIYSSRRGIAEAASHRLLSEIVSSLEDKSPDPANPSKTPSATAEPSMPWASFETTLTQADLPGDTAVGHIVDIYLARQVYRILYTGALFLRFQLLLELQNVTAAATVADRLPPDMPLTLTMRAQILANTGKPKEAATLATRVIMNPKSSARLALQVVQLSGERPDRVGHLKEMTRRMDNRPGHRFFMASLLQKIWYGDMAERFYRNGLRANPLRFSGYRELARVTGTADPLEEALEVYDHVAALHIAAGNFYAEQADPEEAETSLPFYKQASLLAPRETTPVLKRHRVLLQLGRPSEAVTVLKETLDQGNISGSGELQLRNTLASTYLDLKQTQNAMVAIDPVKPMGGAEITLVMARLHEVMGDYKKAFAAYREMVQQFPDDRHIRAAAAGFNWRVGRFKVAADLVAAGRRAGLTGCRWYLEHFALAFRSAPEDRLLSAATHLRDAGTDLSEIRRLAFGLEERRAFSAAFTLMHTLFEEGDRQDIDLAVRMAVLLRAWKGETVAGEFLEDYLKTPLPADQAEVLYRYGFFKPILEGLADVSQYPREVRERIRLIHLSAWFGTGRTADGLDDRMVGHYRGSWLQRKKAQVTGHISPDPDHLAGRYLLGMTSRSELLERIDSPRLRCQYPYIAGLSKRAIGAYSVAAAWYQLTRESLQVNLAEFGWATNEMFWWAHLGNRHRNRNLEADISAYFQSLPERTDQ